MSKISIIIPVYNTEKYLPDCLDSLVNQTLTDLEFIIINDGSTDNSLQICQKYADIDARFKIYTKPNGGLSSAKNYGLKLVNSPYFAFVDSDDYIHPEMMAELYSNAKKTNSDLTTCNYVQLTYEGDTYHSAIPIIFPHNNNLSSITLNLDAKKDCIQLAQIIHVQPIASWNKLYKTSIYKDIIFSFGRKYEDAVVFMDLFHRAKQLTIINKPLYYYRLNRPGSIFSAFLNKTNLDFDFIDINTLLYMEMKNFFIDKNLSSKDLAKLYTFMYSRYRTLYEDITRNTPTHSYLKEKQIIFYQMEELLPWCFKTSHQLEHYFIRHMPNLYHKFKNFLK